MSILPPIKTVARTTYPRAATTSPQAYNPGTGPLLGSTNHYGFNLINFDWITWHTYEHANWMQVDALLYTALLNFDVSGTWQPTTAYVAGDRVLNLEVESADYGRILQCLVNHTSGADVDADIAAGRWELFNVTSGFVNREGDTMLGPLELARDAVLPMEPITKRVYDAAWAAQAVVDQTQTDDIADNASDIAANAAAILALQGLQGNYVNKSGDTMTGLLTLDAGYQSHLLFQNGTADKVLMTPSSEHTLDVLFRRTTGATRFYRFLSPHEYTTSPTNATMDAISSAVLNVLMGDTRYTQYMGTWSAGTYGPNKIVTYNGVVYISTATTSTTPPGTGWQAIGSSAGSSVTYGDAFPASVQPGAMHYLTVSPVGLYMLFEDADSTQWISVDQSGWTDALEGYLPLTGGTITGDVVFGECDVFMRHTGFQTISFTDGVVEHGSIYRNYTTNPGKMFLKVADINGTNSLYYTFRANTTAASDGDVLRRIDGDGRYLQLTGGDLTGTVTTTGGVVIKRATDFLLTMYRTDVTDELAGIAFRRYGDGNEYISVQGMTAAGGIGTAIARFDLAGDAAPNAGTIMTRQKGDARYLQLEASSIQDVYGNFVVNNTTNPYGGGTSGTATPVADGAGVRIASPANYGQINLQATEASSVTASMIQIYKNTTRTLMINANGDVMNANNSYGSLSDMRLKENVSDLSPQLDDLMQLRPVHFNLIGSTVKQAGLIAQEVQAVKPGLVDEGEDGVLSVKYSVLVPLLVKAVQELAQQLKELQDGAGLSKQPR